MSDLRTLVEALHCTSMQFCRYKHEGWGWRVYLVRWGEHEIRLDDAGNGWPMVALVATCEALGLFYRFRELRCGSPYTSAEMRYECEACHPTVPDHARHNWH